MDQLSTIIAIAALLGSALVAGVFFALSSFVMKALARLPAPEGSAAMQSIKVVPLSRALGRGLLMPGGRMSSVKRL